MKYIFVSTNEKKFNEIKSMFPNEIILEKHELTEIQGSIEDLVKLKAKEAYKLVKKDYKERICVICDDVGLEITALNGFPGIYCKQFLKIGIDKIEKLMDKFDKEVYVVGSLGIFYLDKENNPVNLSFVHRVKGKFVFDRETINKKSFGFDPIFLPDGSPQTYAELSKTEKNVISHRGQGLFQVIKYLDKEGEL